MHAIREEGNKKFHAQNSFWDILMIHSKQFWNLDHSNGA